MTDDPVGLPNVYVLIAAAFTVGPLLGVVFTAVVTYMLGRKREIAAQEEAKLVAADVKLAAVEEAAKVKHMALDEASKVKTAVAVESEKQHALLEEIRRLLSGCHEVELARQDETLTAIMELKGDIATLRSALTSNPGPAGGPNEASGL